MVKLLYLKLSIVYTGIKKIPNAAVVLFMVQDGCGFVLTKGMIVLTSGPGMTRKLKNE